MKKRSKKRTKKVVEGALPEGGGDDREPELICDCGATSDDPTGWLRGDGGAPDRCPECRVLDPDGGDSTCGGLTDPATLTALGALAAEAERELEEEEAEVEP